MKQLKPFLPAIIWAVIIFLLSVLPLGKIFGQGFGTTAPGSLAAGSYFVAHQPAGNTTGVLVASLASGATYTPTITPITSGAGGPTIDSIGTFMYQRTGNIVTLSGYLLITPKVGELTSVFDVSLPALSGLTIDILNDSGCKVSPAAVPGSAPYTYAFKNSTNARITSYSNFNATQRGAWVAVTLKYQ